MSIVCGVNLWESASESITGEHFWLSVIDALRKVIQEEGQRTDNRPSHLEQNIRIGLGVILYPMILSAYPDHIQIAGSLSLPLP